MFGLMEGMLSFFRRQVGLRTDAADATGSLHAKVGDLKDDIATVLSSSVIKSIQRGVVQLYTSYPQTITISAVDTSKSIVLCSGDGVESSNATYMTYLSLANSTQLTLDEKYAEGGNFYNSSGGVALSWQVIEFN